MKFNPNRIKEIRIQQCMTQEELAIAMGWKSRSAVAKRELGDIEIGANELQRMAEILKVEDLSVFFDE